MQFFPYQAFVLGLGTAFIPFFLKESSFTRWGAFLTYVFLSLYMQPKALSTWDKFWLFCAIGHCFTILLLAIEGRMRYLQEKEIFQSLQEDKILWERRFYSLQGKTEREREDLESQQVRTEEFLQEKEAKIASLKKLIAVSRAENNRLVEKFHQMQQENSTDFPQTFSLEKEMQEKDAYIQKLEQEILGKDTVVSEKKKHIHDLLSLTGDQPSISLSDISKTIK